MAIDCVLNNPHELGEDDIKLIVEGLQSLAFHATSAGTRLNARELSEQFRNCYTVWLDLNE